MSFDMVPESRFAVVLNTGEVGKTEQSHKAACDINNIMRKYAKTGLILTRTDGGLYGDFSAVGDYHGCINKVADARADFLSLPSGLRKRFRNDPAELLSFVLDESNRPEAVKLGLVPPPPPEEPPVAPPVPPVGG